NWQFSEYAVKSKVKVLKTLRGKEYNEIDITQLGSLGQECILVEGQKYMLLLGNQNEPNNDYTFYIKGEIQGKILIKDDEPIAADIVIEKDIKSIIRKNKENKKGIEKLNDYFMNEPTTPQNGN
ncbi:MAG: hypothetical protein HGA22_01650, partial [Clostridiales bacterium]|nr:hypothetical protein [Clostridiales bacterium]